MHRYYVLCLLSALLLTIQNAQAIEVSGSVSGRWTASDNPVTVIDNITVDAEKSLYVDPGVIIYVNDNVEFEVNGLLDMRGTTRNPIIIDSNNGGYWGGIFINDAVSQDGRMRYVKLYHTIAGIIVNNSYFYVNNCDISVEWRNDRHNDVAIASRDGSHLTVELSNASIISGLSDVTVVEGSYSTLQFDSSEVYLDIFNETGINNGYGTGVRLDHVSGSMKGCYLDLVSMNAVNSSGPLIGIDIISADDFLIHNNGIHIVTGSSIWSAAVAVQSTNIDINHFSIHLQPTAPAANIVGVGVRSESRVELKNTIIANFDDAYFDNCYSCFSWAITSNINVRFCDIYNMVNPENPEINYQENLDSDPQWREDESKYRLSANSPCIDMGELGSIDPDNTRLDIGMHYYDQSNNKVELEKVSIQPADFILESIYPNPFNSNVIININNGSRQHLNVKIYNVIGSYVTDISRYYNKGSNIISWNGADLSSGVYFVNISSTNTAITKKIELLR
ncbi:T9SS type A sorting domain-containing protein [Calditrichota bacterium]